MDNLLKMQLKKIMNGYLQNAKAADFGIDEKTWEQMKTVINQILGDKEPNVQGFSSTSPESKSKVSFLSFPFAIKEDNSLDRASTMSQVNFFISENPQFKIVNIETFYENGKESGFRVFYFS